MNEKIELSLSWGFDVVGCRWVFTMKYQLDGTMDRYKARFVVKGFT